MNSQQTIIEGNRAVIINQQGEGNVWANLYVNARNGIQDADITMQRWTGKTVAGARRWAARMLAS